MRSTRLAAAGAAFMLAALLAGCGGSSNKATTSTAAAGGSSNAATTSTATATKTGCTVVASPPAMPAGKLKKPTTVLDKSKTYDVTIVTNCGSFTFRLDQAQSPHATASFVSLVQRGFFNKTVFHRIAVGFVIQGGDPTGTGSGGPGYETVDTPPASANYTHGVVAMAKTQTEAPGTAGSQFFVVTAPNAGLTPDYAIIGKVTKGLAVVDRIGTLGDANQAPTMVVEIIQATVKES
ncbi:MAG TPA: peptidylprolyl isomerase [Gaiellaceae bacterium]|jgi:peptidyl-prolyl cis-trans isomerase B (cyclophilin B)|nr:peptidylprolyl isomerase [Gaiellaceae bacterium]